MPPKQDISAAKQEAKAPLNAKLVAPDSFEDKEHFYTRVLNATIHPLVETFMHLGNDRIIERYLHLHPTVDRKALTKLLKTQPTHFHWAGADLFQVVNIEGKKQMVVIETNSCPSGQKSMPGSTKDTSRGYHRLMRKAFLPLLKRADLPEGNLAVVFDKNDMECTGYAAAMADVMQEPVYLVQFYKDDRDPPVRFVEGVMQVRTAEGVWVPIRAAFRYVTQKPWNRIPIETKTVFLNSTICCLAGGRNKMTADKAYEIFNGDELDNNLRINVPETRRDVNKDEIPMWVHSMGGHAVVKVPYSNAGQGVYTITNEKELKTLMDAPEAYDKYIVQSLIGNAQWCSTQRDGAFYHCGSIPDKKNNIYVSDIRMMVVSDEVKGISPIAIYARRALKPLVERLTPESNSWDILGTNLSIKKEDGTWTTDTNRLMLMDTKDFNKLGLGLDDLIDGYIQTVMAMTAIDRMAHRLMPAGAFDQGLYASINADPSFLKEIVDK